MQCGEQAVAKFREATRRARFHEAAHVGVVARLLGERLSSQVRSRLERRKQITSRNCSAMPLALALMVKNALAVWAEMNRVVPLNLVI
jgi:hypothetical protein